MARYVGLLTSDMRGKVGGVVFTRNVAGTSVRPRVVPVRQQFGGQAGPRAMLSAAVARWKALTVDQRTSWQSLAPAAAAANSLGLQLKPSGYQLFQAAAITASMVGATSPDQAPALFPEFRIPGAVSGFANSGDPFITTYPDFGGYTTTGYISAGLKVSNQGSPTKNVSTRFMAAIDPSQETFIGPQYLAAFGRSIENLDCIPVRIHMYDPASFLAGPVAPYTVRFTL